MHQVLLLLLLLLVCLCVVRGGHIPLPENFYLGVSSSAYQIEGASNEDGKKESIWDRLQHENHYWIQDGSNADISCNSYHKIEEDIQILKRMNLKMYRFSISWPRILPNGDLSFINQKGIEHYNKLIDGLIDAKIEPAITLYHWDLPDRLQREFGGWLNPNLAKYFEDYAWVLFSNYGDRVKWWLTFNEPIISCLGYAVNGLYMAPGMNLSGVGEYQCIHTQLLAHGRAYRLYEKDFRMKQKGQVGISLNLNWIEPKTSNPKDQEAANDFLMWELGWVANPIFSKTGDYPPILKKRILENSMKEGLRRSRLPEFTKDEIKMIHNSADFFGVNTYSTNLASRGETGLNPSWERDSRVILSQDKSWPDTAAYWIKNTPWSITKLLIYINKQYPNHNLLITENGYADKGDLYDVDRVIYIQEVMRYLLKAIYEYKIPLIGYLHWSLLDNFEWVFGYTLKFGLNYVNFNDTNRKRIMKYSGYVFSEIAKNWSVPVDETCDNNIINWTFKMK